jgi:non-homologous end joining protein Ku
MAGPRANWKDALRIGAVECGVALYTAASTAERVSFHILNRKTGAIQGFVPCGEVDDIYFDRPYYLARCPGRATACAKRMLSLSRAPAGCLRCRRQQPYSA